MLVIDLPSYNIHWKFDWIYRTRPAEKPNTFYTITYLRWKELGNSSFGDKGIIVSANRKDGNFDKDNERIATLYKGITKILGSMEVDFDDYADMVVIANEVMKKYAAQARVPKPQTKLGEWQMWLKEFLETQDEM